MSTPIPGTPPNSPSYRLSTSDSYKLFNWIDINRPEPPQLSRPQFVPDLTDPKEEVISTSNKLDTIKSLAASVLDKADIIKEKIDNKCSRFKVSSKDGVGSDLFQAMIRVFDERTTTITYDHYKKALIQRQQLAEEDAAKLKLQ